MCSNVLNGLTAKKEEVDMEKHINESLAQLGNGKFTISHFNLSRSIYILTNSKYTNE